MDRPELQSKLDKLGHRFKVIETQHFKLSKQSSDDYTSRWAEIGDAFGQWKYEHRKLSTWLNCLICLVFCLLLISFLWGASSSSFGRAMGLETIRYRIVHTYYAVTWAARVGDLANIDIMEPDRRQGYIERIIDDKIVVSYFRDGKQERRLIKPANVVITDQQGFQSWAMQYQLQPLTLDFYLVLEQAAGYDVWAAVMWQSREPINVQLVERGMGQPEVSPPTAVVNKIYSQYYWSLARDGLGSKSKIE